jgi:hypothetical protein
MRASNAAELCEQRGFRWQLRLHTNERVYFDIFTAVGTFSLPMDVARTDRYSRMVARWWTGKLSRGFCPPTSRLKFLTWRVTRA